KSGGGSPGRATCAVFWQKGKENEMKKLTCQVSGVLFLLGFLTGSALAGVLKSKLLCEPGVSGRATITSTGGLKVKATGLIPGFTYEVEITCGCVEDQIDDPSSEPFEVFATAGIEGKLTVKEKNAVTGVTCHCPAVAIEDTTFSDDDPSAVVCISGFEF